MTNDKIDFIEDALSNSSEYKWKNTGKPKTLSKLISITDEHLKESSGDEFKKLAELKETLSAGG